MIFHQPHNSQTNHSHNAHFYTDEIWDYHFHKNPEIIYVLEGAVDCTVNENNYTLKKGEFGLCLSYDRHSYKPLKNTHYWVIVFSEDYIRYFVKQTSGKTGNGFKFNCSKSVKDFVVYELINNKKPSELIIKSCLYAVCEQYIKSVELIDDKIKSKETVALIVDYIFNNHTKNLKLADIAKNLGYDYNYMSRNFKKLFKMTFTEFLNIYRLETAVRLLDETDYNISRIAFESGFQSVRAFNDFFKKQMKTSPSQYKKQVKAFEK